MGQIAAGARLYRPQGIKQVVIGSAWNKGTSFNSNNQVDLSTPVIGFRFVLKYRIAVTVAAYTSVKPENLLNIIQELRISGQNSLLGGNVTIFDMDMASWCGFQSLLGYRPYEMFVSKAAGANTITAYPSTPYSVGGFDGTVANFDVIQMFDVPMPPSLGGDQFAAGFALRQSEWSDTLQIYAKFAALADNAENEIGVSAATTVTTLTSYGSATGSPTLDVYSLGNIAGKVNDANITPGVLSRTYANMSANLVSGNAIALVPNLQKQTTGRVFFKVGVSTLFPNYSSLNDFIVTAAGITVAQNKPVRNLLDTFAHKLEIGRHYQVDPIQGYNVFDFLNSKNPFSAFAGANQNVVGPGATFQLTGNVTAVANNALLAMQEQMLLLPSGPLYKA